MLNFTQPFYRCTFNGNGGALFNGNLHLIDLEIPKFSGLELIEKIRQHYPKSEVPIVVHSGSQNAQSIMSAYHLGANAYLYKSINFAESLQHLNAMLQYFSRMYQEKKNQ